MCIDRNPIFLIRENPRLSVAGFRFISKNKFHLRKQIEQRLARIDVHIVGRAEFNQVWRTIRACRRKNIAKAVPGFQRRRAKCHRYVVDEQWPIGNPQTVVPTNLVTNVRLKQNVFKRFRAMKT